MQKCMQRFDNLWHVYKLAYYLKISITSYVFNIYFLENFSPSFTDPSFQASIAVKTYRLLYRTPIHGPLTVTQKFQLIGVSAFRSNFERALIITITQTIQ